MKVQIWSDFVCPFCYIGKRHLEQAIKELGEDVEVEMMSYELDSDSNAKPGGKYFEIMADKFNQNTLQARNSHKPIIAMAKEVGLDFNFEIAQPSNTFKAHKLFQYAKEQGKGNEVAEVLLNAYFSKGVYLDDCDTLIDLVKEFNFDEKTIRLIIQGDEYGLKVRQDQNWAKTIGVKGVPHFVIDDQVFLSGAQPVETFKSALLHVKTLNFNKMSETSGMMCEDGSCEIK